MSRTAVAKALRAEAKLDEIIGRLRFRNSLPGNSWGSRERYVETYRSLIKLQEEVHGLTAMMVAELDAQEDKCLTRN
jgi:hypothetical protein